MRVSTKGKRGLPAPDRHRVTATTQTQQDLAADTGFSGSYQSVKRFIRQLRRTQPMQARAVIVTAPGEESQVDRLGMAHTRFDFAFAQVHAKPGGHWNGRFWGCPLSGRFAVLGWGLGGASSAFDPVVTEMAGFG